MRVKTYEVLSRAVEEGVMHGWRRAYKHTEAPNEQAVQQAVIEGAMEAICEVFSFYEARDEPAS
jgi:hypothetical protein